MIYLLLFVLGIAVGSFLNVVSLRYEPGQKLFGSRVLGGRSRCRNCRKILSWYELLPLLSFSLQKGKCRSCGEKLLWQYPLVEFLTGLIFVAVPWRLGGFSLGGGQWLIVATWILVFLLFLLLSIIDFRESVIPDSVNLSLGILGLILFALTLFYERFNAYSSQFLGHYALLFGFRDNIYLNYLLALLSGTAFFWLIILLSRGRAMGWGDFKLAAALGILFGWPEIIILLIFSFIAGAAASLFLMARREKTIKDLIPFGPFLVVGAVLVFFFGYRLMDAYFKLFNIRL